MNKKFIKLFEDISSIDNLLRAWEEFVRGKRMRKDVQKYSLRLMDNILSLHKSLVNKVYCHGQYFAFQICDPKPRNIHKAQIRDRLLHHAIYRIIYPLFDKIFIADSFSCRNKKGLHKAIGRFNALFLQESKNNIFTCYVLKCDIKKFFANIDHSILINLLCLYIADTDAIDLLTNVIRSFNKKGLPLGNLTSQLFVNIYMNEFDQFIKQELKIKSYIRYCDDFVILSRDKKKLIRLVPQIEKFLCEKLKLELNHRKLSIQTVYSGVDFLGWKHFPRYRVLRTQTKHRLLKRIMVNPKLNTYNSYLGLLKHGNTQKIQKLLWKEFLSHQNQ